jgi:hypothetical protein
LQQKQQIGHQAGGGTGEHKIAALWLRHYLEGAHWAVEALTTFFNGRGITIFDKEAAVGLNLKKQVAFLIGEHRDFWHRTIILYL